MGSRGFGVSSGWLIILLLCWPGLAAAGTFQLQVASLPERAFLHFVEGSTLPRIESFLDNTRRSKFVLFRDRQPQVLKFRALGLSAPFHANVSLPKQNDPWGVTAWEGETGQLVVFRIRGMQSDHQWLRRVAVQRDGVLTRLPVRSVPGPLRSQGLAAPATTVAFVTHALERGTFPAWVERRAATYDGLSVVVARSHNAQESDTVYLVVRMPQAGRTYKVILGWKTVRREGSYVFTHGKGK